MDVSSTGRRLRPRVWMLIPAALLCALCFGTTAAQQTADDEAEDKAEAIEGQGIRETVVVTARRKEETLQEVPVAVSVVQGSELEDTGAPDLSSLQAEVPNLAVYDGRNQSTTLTAFLRGIGQADPLWGVDPGVGLYLDDVYIARPQGALLSVFDLERIEVLRGPQGTLYGKNTIGGAIKYVSKQLDDEFAGRIAISPGTEGTQDVKFAFSGPLVEGKLRGKVAFASLRRDGFGRNFFQGLPVNDRDTRAGRVALDWLPADRTTVRFSYDRTEDRAQPKGYARLQANPLCPAFLAGNPCNPLDGRYDVEAGLEQLNGTDSEGVSVVVEHAINDAWTFKSISAYRESDTLNNIDFDTTPARITDVMATYSDEQTSQEFQLLYGGDGPLNGVFGLYYFDGEAGGLVQNIFFDSIFGTTEGFTETESIAVFGDGSYRLSDQLTFNFGLRYTDEEKRGVAFNAGYTDDTFSTVDTVTADYDQTESFPAWSPRLGLDYEFSDDVMGYVSVSQGFKSGGFNVRAQATAFPESANPFDDEELTVAEVGLKSVLVDRRLLLNAALFYGDYTDIQVSTFTAFDSDGDGIDDSFFGNFLNAGDATLSGVEVEFDWRSASVPWFGINGNMSYLDASPDDFLDANQDGFVDTQVLTNAPEFTGALNLTLNKATAGGLVRGSIGVAYRGEATLTNEGGPDPGNPTQPLSPIIQDSYALINASVGWLSSDGTWGFTVNGRNLNDKGYLTNGYNIPVLGILTGSFGAPRIVSATFEYNF